MAQWLGLDQDAQVSCVKYFAFVFSIRMSLTMRMHFKPTRNFQKQKQLKDHSCEVFRCWPLGNTI